MLNIDDRLLISGITADQLYLLLHIAKHMNKDMTCFPSNATLCLSTAWGLTKLKEVKKSLIVDGYLSSTERKNGEFQLTNLYKIETEHLSVWVNLKGKGGEEQGVVNATGGMSETRPGGVANATTEVLTSEVLNSSSIADQNFEKWAKDVFDDRRTFEAFCMSRKLPKGKYEAYKDQFIAEARTKTEEYKRRVDVLNHFLNYSSRLFDIEKEQAARTAKNAQQFANKENDVTRFYNQIPVTK